MDYTGFFQHALDLAQPYLDRYGYAAIFALVFVEGLGIPAPGQIMIIAAALLAARGQLHILSLFATAWTAAVIGDNLGYAIGRFGGRRLLLRCGRFVGVNEAHLARVEGFFARYGGGMVAAARFFEVLRQINGLVAGTSGMPWWRFLGFNALGAALWVGLWGFGVYALERHLAQVLALFKRLEPYVIAACLLAAVWLAFYTLRWRRAEAERP